MATMILYGEPEEIRAGKGHPTMFTTQAAARLGVSERRFRQFVEDGLISRVAKLLGADLFLESDVEKLATARAATGAQQS